MLLRRTLRSSPQIGGIVHSLKVPAAPAGAPPDDYHNLVASVVMACPNLERLVGLYPNYNHTFSRLFHALSTRSRLKDMVWMVDTPAVQQQHSLRPRSGSKSNLKLPQELGPIMPKLTPGELLPQHGAAFIDHHVNWRHLTTLAIHCQPGATLAPGTLLSTTLAFLPSLQNLHLSRLPAAAFNDGNLAALPPLKRLSLAHMPGVSSAGLSALATTMTSQSLEKLSLRHVNIDLLPALARVLSNCVRLTALALVQNSPPVLPEDTFIWLMPYLASGSLRRLHWDITGQPSFSSAADSLLARSIAAGGFPALHSLRTPNDPDGIFQALCRPQDRADVSADRFRGLGPNSYGGPATGYGLGRPGTPGSPTKLPGPGAGGGPRTPTSPMFPRGDGPGVVLRECSDLRESRLAAQARLEAARRLPRYFVNVIDEDGTLCEKFGIAGFLGTVESRITYDLMPDVGATDESGGLVGVTDLLGDGGEDFGALGRAGCSGRWNMTRGSADRKDRDRWWHTERGRWKAPELS